MNITEKFGKKNVIITSCAAVAALALVVGVSCGIVACNNNNKGNDINSLRSKYEYVDENKDSIYLGYYPQSKVEDESLIKTLNDKAGSIPTESNFGSWNDYKYYQSGVQKSYMFYIDIDENKDGYNDYRGVYFTSYRPESTSDGEPSETYSYQVNAGYTKNNVYWFKYEKIKWLIISNNSGKAQLLSELQLDAQSYLNIDTQRSEATDYQGNKKTGTIYQNNYQFSSIRSWINQDFYNTAFSDKEKDLILTTTVDNGVDSVRDNEADKSFVCDNTEDKLFLLSFKECSSNLLTNYEANGSDYALSQGLISYVSDNVTHYASYWMRSPAQNSGEARIMSSSYYQYETKYNSMGVRVSCNINL